MVPRQSSRKFSLGWLQYPILTIIGCFLFISIILPLGILIWTSLHNYYVQPSLSSLNTISLEQYVNLFNDSRFIPALLNTAAVVTIVPTLAVFTAVISAWVTQRKLANLVLIRILDTLSSSSIAIPGIIAANGLLIFYLKLNSFLPLWFPLWGTIVALILAYSYRIALAYRIQKAGFLQLSLSLEEASYTSGAGLWTTLRRISIPLTKPNWAGAWILLSIYALREMTLPLVIHSGGPPELISTLMWKLWGYETGEAAALAVISIILTIIFLLSLWHLLWKK